MSQPSERALDEVLISQVSVPSLLLDVACVLSGEPELSAGAFERGHDRRREGT
jgi:hypothetical protein